jgi:hypothetical protein
VGYERTRSRTGYRRGLYVVPKVCHISFSMTRVCVDDFGVVLSAGW